MSHSVDEKGLKTLRGIGQLKIRASIKRVWSIFAFVSRPSTFWVITFVRGKLRTIEH